MDTQKETLATKIFEEKEFIIGATIHRYMDFYAKTMDIVERTNAAMGKKSAVNYATASTVNGNGEETENIR